MNSYDVNNDGIVNVLDMILVGQNFGKSGVPEDINADGIVNVLDLILVGQHFGQSLSTLKGVVTDGSTSLPLSGATAVLASNSITTDAGGNYIFTNVPPGNVAVTFSKIGYITQNF